MMLWSADQQEILQSLGYQVLSWNDRQSLQIPFEDRLFQAIVRAAGQQLEAAETVYSHCISLQELRKSPQKKKQLWPVLRHMRG